MIKRKLCNKIAAAITVIMLGATFMLNSSTNAKANNWTDVSYYGGWWSPDNYNCYD